MKDRLSPITHLVQVLRRQSSFQDFDPASDLSDSSYPTTDAPVQALGGELDTDGWN